MSVTIKDIAKIAQVSHSTVSRSLNDSPRVANDTKKKIKGIAKELGFEFNAQARSLSTSRTNTIGIIYNSNLNDSYIHFLSNTVQKLIRISLEKKDLDTITTFTDNIHLSQNNITRLINTKKIDGLIIIGAQIDLKTLNFMDNSNIPYVFCHNIPDQDSNVDALYCDHFLGGYLATEHLLNLGHKNLLCIQRSDNSPQFSMRTNGFIAALKDNNIDFDDTNFSKADYNLEGGYKFVKENIDYIKKFSALFVHTDTQALGIIEGLKEEGIKIPNDISIVGYDDIQLGSFYKPHLTTIHQPIEQLVILTCERLIELLESKKCNKSKQIIIPPKLVIRDSTAAPLKIDEVIS